MCINQAARNAEDLRVYEAYLRVGNQEMVGKQLCMTQKTVSRAMQRVKQRIKAGEIEVEMREKVAQR